MYGISSSDIAARIARDNPWWRKGGNSIREAKFPRRAYFPAFKRLALNFGVSRAPILLGPRRVGKTVILKQLIYETINEGFNAQNILYASVDTPVYAGMPLEGFLAHLPDPEAETCVVLFDEIQYLREWELHLKDLVDSYPNVKFIATGSAAAALKLKSRESGAGRFTELILPPLTFQEFLVFIEKEDYLIQEQSADDNFYISKDLVELNSEFINYLNFGGYPEAVLNPEIRENADQFVRNDIIDKVLLKDLPTLYGIENIQELNRLFSFLAYNTGNEATLENISQNMGLAKPTIKKYIEYLESAFLIIKLSTVDDNCRRLQRERHFKIYLNNPSMRAALFAPVGENEGAQVGHLAEAAVFAQWQHSVHFRNLRYARWRNQGEVDIVLLSKGQNKPHWIGEIKWSDRAKKDFQSASSNIAWLLRKHPMIESAFLTTKTFEMNASVHEVPMSVIPTALYCYTVGRNVLKFIDGDPDVDDAPPTDTRGGFDEIEDE